MKQCERMETLIQLYVDEVATAKERRLVHAHVADCARCAARLVELRRLISILSSLPGRELGAEFDQKLFTAIKEMPPARAIGWWQRFQLRVGWRFQTSALVLGSGLAVALLAATLGPFGFPKVFPSSDPNLGELVHSAVERHLELSQRAADSSWDAIDTSIDLSTGYVLSD